MAKIAKFFEPKLRVVLYRICSETCWKNNRKTPVPNYLFYKVAGFRDPTLWARRLRRLPVKTVKFFGIAFLHDTYERLPLRYYNLVIVAKFCF